jgi:hypothetical protein
MNSRARSLGIAVIACGVLMAVLPALPWFGADLPTGRADLTGYGAGGVAWILPVIGAALITAGVLTAWWTPPPGTRPARLLGGGVVLMAALGVAWSALIALAPRIDVVAARAGLPDAPLSGDWAVSALAPAWICMAAAALAGMAGILLLTPRPDDLAPEDSAAG